MKMTIKTPSRKIRNNTEMAIKRLKERGLASSTKQTQYIEKLRQTVQTGTLSPFMFNSLLEYQKQRRERNGLKQDKALFTGQKKGLIHVFIKRDQQEQFAQSHFHFFEDDLSAKNLNPK